MFTTDTNENIPLISIRVFECHLFENRRSFVMVIKVISGIFVETRQKHK